MEMANGTCMSFTASDYVSSFRQLLERIRGERQKYDSLWLSSNSWAGCDTLESKDLESVNFSLQIMTAI